MTIEPLVPLAAELSDTLEGPTCVRGVPIFRALPSEGLAALSRAMRHRHFAKGQWIASEGDPIEHLLIVDTGLLKLVHVTSRGREQVVRTLGPGDFFGEMALFAPARYGGELSAIEPTDVCLVPRGAVQRVLQAHPDAAIRVVEALARRLAEAEQMIGDLGLRDVGQRLAGELVRLAASGTPGPDGVRVRMPVPWSELALKLGTTPESLSRRLGALADQGVIRQERGRTVVLCEINRLRAIATG